MVTKSKLKMALAADKGTDFGKLHLKKKEKLANKLNQKKAKKSGDKNASHGKLAEEEWEDVEEEKAGGGAEFSEGESGSDEEIDAPMKA